ncbi:RodZ domain-containing protein [Marinomonas flavescens]|uniref:RodZ domain-containing protein n=1 Tax=Marinomonas flavescens TaxID=2529379 RepID=UPI001F0A651E|nr:RodZ domain-containing protein [Marinomonas flavescens]
MTTEFQTDVSFNDSDPEKIDIGKTLQAARIKRNLDERQVASELKIPIDQVMALEDNRFNYFRSATFARGYLKGYCRLLEINANDVLKKFDALAATLSTESNIKPVDKVVNKQAGFGDPFVILISVVIIAVLIFLAFWWPTFSSNNSAVIDKQSSANQAKSNDAVSTDQTPILSTAPAQPSDSTNTVVANQAAATITPADAITPADDKPTKEDGVTTGLSAETIAILEKAGVNPKKVEEATKEIPEDSATITPKTPLYSNDIDVTFDADCWTEVRDGSGKILYSGVKTAGSKLELTGTAPYRVVLGYARGVSSFKFKGEVYDFSSYTHKDLARFELK